MCTKGGLTRHSFHRAYDYGSFIDQNLSVTIGTIASCPIRVGREVGTMAVEKRLSTGELVKHRTRQPRRQRGSARVWKFMEMSCTVYSNSMRTRNQSNFEPDSDTMYLYVDPIWSRTAEIITAWLCRGINDSSCKIENRNGGEDHLKCDQRRGTATLRNWEARVPVSPNVQVSTAGAAGTARHGDDMKAGKAVHWRLTASAPPPVKVNDK
ncbi:hypothetical protein J6590_013896 [Homalodisca vitripennis]|nr:hypothetical protein J6590_013896 [Homalodisca vitripennis]